MIYQKYKLTYHEQWGRVVRLRKTLDKYEFAEDRNFEITIDAFYKFFHTVLSHMRDWLIKSSDTKQFIDEAIRQDQWLSLCRDIANNQKHQRLLGMSPRIILLMQDLEYLLQSQNTTARLMARLVLAYRFGSLERL